MLEAPGQQISLTDPDTRSMKHRGSGLVGYNVQAAVDTDHHLIVAHEVTNVGSDRRQLVNMAEIRGCEEAGITTNVPKPLTSPNCAKGHFGRDAFRYIVEDNEYECPAGERLVWHVNTQDKRRTVQLYWTSKCRHCAIKAQCTSGVHRKMTRWEHELMLERAQDAGPGEFRDESARSDIQHEANDECHWYKTADRGDQGIENPYYHS